MALDTAALFIMTLFIKGLLTCAADTCPGEMDSKPPKAGNYLVSASSKELLSAQCHPRKTDRKWPAPGQVEIL